MRTEEHIIIILTVMEESGNININYTSTSDKPNVSIKVTSSDGQSVQSFDQVEKAEKGTLSFASQNLTPGTYTCSIYLDGTEKDSKQFDIGR